MRFAYRWNAVQNALYVDRPRQAPRPRSAPPLSISHAGGGRMHPKAGPKFMRIIATSPPTAPTLVRRPNVRQSAARRLHAPTAERRAGRHVRAAFSGARGMGAA